MSLLNVWLSPERALVAVDTAIVLAENGVRLEASKLVPLAHANLVLAVMGEVAFLGYLYCGIHTALQTVDYDLLADTLPTAIDQLYGQYRLQAKFGGVPLDAFRGCEIVVVGWSTRHQRILGMRCTLRAEDSAFTASEIDPWCILPGADWTAENPPAVDSIEALQHVAAEQVRWTRQQHPGAAIGGRLLIAKLGRDGLTIREAGNLG